MWPCTRQSAGAATATRSFRAPCVARSCSGWPSSRSFARRSRPDAIIPYYQPIVRLQSHDVLGVEALARWSHPVRGVLAPDVFIGVAEDTGLIRTLGEQILNQACDEVHHYNLERGITMGVSVNCSVRELDGRGLVESVAAALEKSQLPSHLLNLEITESLFMEDLRHILPVLRELRSLGLGLTIDDFGVGYSSLSYLRQVPVTALKIDRSFVTNLAADAEARAIVSALIPMAHMLELKVVAEGVETEEHARLLEDLGCDFAQGYLYGRPAPLGVGEARVAGRRRSPGGHGVVGKSPGPPAAGRPLRPRGARSTSGLG